jgi:hypothetical protein
MTGAAPSSPPGAVGFRLGTAVNVCDARDGSHWAPAVLSCSRSTAKEVPSHAKAALSVPPRRRESDGIERHWRLVVAGLVLAVGALMTLWRPAGRPLEV